MLTALQVEVIRLTNGNLLLNAWSSTITQLVKPKQSVAEIENIDDLLD